MSIAVDYDPENNHLWFYAGPRDTDRMQLIPTARHMRGKNAWRVVCTLASVEIAAHLFRPGELAPSERAKRAIQEVRVQRVPELLDADAKAGLRHYQVHGAAFLRDWSALCADEMGTGKSPTVASAFPDHGPVLVACPKSVMYDWEAFVQKWAPSRTPYVVTGNITKRRKILEHALVDYEHAVVIINYEGLMSHSSLVGYGNVVALSDKEKQPKELNDFGWALIVADEAHKICEPKNKSTRALWSLRRQAANAIAMTGTPVVNDADDAWAIMRFVSPDEWPVRSQFRELFCNMRPGYFGGVENLGIRSDMMPLFDRIFQPRYIRRLKRDVLPELPEKTHVTMTIPMSAKQAKAYKEMKKAMITSVDANLVIATDPLTQAMRLREIASGMPETDGDFNVVGLGTPSNKLDAIIEIKESIEGPLVVFAESARLVRMLNSELEQAGYKTAAIWQDVSARARKEYVDAFQDGELDIIVLTTGTGAEGITLTRSDTLVFAQQSWSNARNMQAEDRIHRFGQDRGTTIVTLISEGTIDERTAKVAAKKASNLEQIVRDEISEELGL